MKKTLIVSLLCFTAWSGFAQSVDNNDDADRQQIHNRALSIYCETNGNMPGATMHYKTNYSNVHAAYPAAPADAVPAWPRGEYTALQNPPCYMYKDASGAWMETCPGARFTPPTCDNPQSALTEIQTNNGLDVNSENSFTGNYPDLHTVYPQAPANAVPAWPSTPYKAVQNPPCYKYINQMGLEVTECPGAQFEPEHH